MMYRLNARVRSKNESAVGSVLDSLITKGSVIKVEGEFIIEAEMVGDSAKELNRALLSALRRVENRTTLRAEWTHGNMTDSFFDYILKKTIRIKERTDER